MRKPWAIKDWKDRRKEYIKRKSCEWCGSADHLTIHHLNPEKCLTDKQYFSFEGTIILCRRCHFAIHRGLTLCPKCRQHYKRRGYDTCFLCSDNAVKVITPCGKEEVITRLAWDVMGTSEVCHNCDNVHECNYLTEEVPIQ